MHWFPETEIFATPLDLSEREKETESCSEIFFRYNVVLFPFISLWALWFSLWLLLSTSTSQLALAPGTVAVIIALPAFSPTIVPSSSTLATFVLDETHSSSFTGLAEAFILHLFSSKRIFSWAFSLIEDFLTVTLHCFFTPLHAAVIVTLPIFLGFIFPLLVTSAILAFEDFHVILPLGAAVALRVRLLFR